MTTALAREFLQAYPTPVAVAALTERQWQRWAHAHRLSQARAQELWAVLQQPQLPVPAHVVRAKTRLMQTLLTELAPAVAAVEAYRQAVENFFAALPAAQWIRTLPIGEHGVTAPTLWARLGDAPGRWESFHHLQAHAGAVPVTVKSGKQQVVHFRFACDKALRSVVDQVAFLSLRSSEWARAYYDEQRARGHSHREALRALGAKWLKIIFVLWAGRCRMTSSTTWRRWHGSSSGSARKKSLDMDQRKSLIRRESRSMITTLLHLLRPFPFPLRRPPPAGSGEPRLALPGPPGAARPSTPRSRPWSPAWPPPIRSGERPLSSLSWCLSGLSSDHRPSSA